MKKEKINGNIWLEMKISEDFIRKNQDKPKLGVYFCLSKNYLKILFVNLKIKVDWLYISIKQDMSESLFVNLVIE